MACETGNSCPENETCVVSGPRRRTGCCQCKEGYILNANQTCLLPSNSSLSNEVSTLSTEVSSIPTTTPIYIKHLAISISPTVIQLPEKQSQITAIVVPDPEEGEKYAYKWSIPSFPEGSTGDVEDSNEKVLKLSNLQPGNYSLHIQVNSALSFGETLVNLTVLPRKQLSLSCSYWQQIGNEWQLFQRNE